MGTGSEQGNDRLRIQVDDIRKCDKLLYMMVGLPRSGKSTWARWHSSRHNDPIVSPDAIRLALHGQQFIASAEPTVWATARLMVASLFLAGHSAVILDACNITVKRREEWASREWGRIFVVVDTPPDVCIRRANDTMKGAIARMASCVEPPTAGEGHVGCIHVPCEGSAESDE